MKDINEKDLETNLRLVAKQQPDHRTIVKVGPVEIGGDKVVVMAGPCAVESEEQVIEIAAQVKQAGAAILRGGAFKPLTFPYRNEKMFELRERGLVYLKEAGKRAGLPVVSEVMDVRLVQTVADYVDMIQIGARSMQNFPLLEEVAKTGKPVLLKRHPGASLRDWLGAAEYVLYYGNSHVVLCERGIAAPHTHQPTSRFIVDLQVVPAVHEYTHLPVIVDASHATFRREYVAPIARGAVAVGADGLLLDVHPVPEKAAVDPLQALNYQAFARLMQDVKGIAAVLGRTA
ncbi:MAG: 3-deoxy-7-phosphoheptulonate synthase [Nitrospirae bacterium]|nr:3-deoxy-7-phosphoheptulonate synthase [Nitrospirota bacterium]